MLPRAIAIAAHSLYQHSWQVVSVILASLCLLQISQAGLNVLDWDLMLLSGTLALMIGMRLAQQVPHKRS